MIVIISYSIIFFIPFLLLDRLDSLNYYFFSCAIVSDLYLLQEIVLLSTCFIFFKKLILPFIKKVTTRP